MENEHERRVRSSSPPARWAMAMTHATVAVVVPSAVWRTAVGVGFDLGWSDEQLDRQQIPGTGTVYVIALSLLSVGAASLTYGLVRPWGERVPSWIPVFGNRAVPRVLAVTSAVVGAVVVMFICVLSIVRWDDVSGFSADPDSGWARLMIAAYVPVVLWGPLLLGVTWDYWRRRGR